MALDGLGELRESGSDLEGSKHLIVTLDVFEPSSLVFRQLLRGHFCVTFFSLNPEQMKKTRTTHSGDAAGKERI